MATKVFISWSGNLSNKLADAVSEWLPNVLQSVKPYLTSSNIEKGAKWASSISRELENSDVGIIFLTKENLEEPWILFEAGSLSKNLDNSKVCTLLFEIDSIDLKGPLAMFQNTRFKKNDFKKLVKSINNSGGDSKLNDSVLDKVFDMWWEKLDLKIKSILSSHKNTDHTEHRPERDILKEILELSRLNARGQQSKRHDFSPRILMDLVEAIEELLYTVDIKSSSKNSKETHMILKRLDRPIKYLCSNSGHSKVYNKYQHLMETHAFIHGIDEDEYDEENKNTKIG